MKPFILCKTISILVFFMIIGHFSMAQCGDQRNSSIIAYLQYKGAGWEMGWWPAANPLGFFGGMSVSKQIIASHGKDSTQEIIGTEVYGKLQLRLFERIALTSTAGFVNAQQFYYAAGLRFNLPLNNKTALVGEPQIGNRGFNLMLGVAKRF